MYRTKNCGELKIQNVGEQVELAGWIQKIRNLGGMIFIDLRDEFGITQIVINDEKMDDENTQTEFLNTKISSGKISKDKLKQGVYKITRKGNSYLIDDIK